MYLFIYLFVYLFSPVFSNFYRVAIAVLHRHRLEELWFRRARGRGVLLVHLNTYEFLRPVLLVRFLLSFYTVLVVIGVAAVDARGGIRPCWAGSRPGRIRDLRRQVDSI